MIGSNIIDFDQEERKLQTERSTSKLMKSELVEKALEIVKDPHTLITMVSKRVRQLNMGRPPLTENTVGFRLSDIALTEIIEGKIVLVENLEES